MEEIKRSKIDVSKARASDFYMNRLKNKVKWNDLLFICYLFVNFDIKVLRDQTYFSLKLILYFLNIPISFRPLGIFF